MLDFSPETTTVLSQSSKSNNSTIIENKSKDVLSQLKDNLMKEVSNYANLSQQTLINEQNEINKVKESFMAEISLYKKDPSINPSYIHQLFYLKLRKRFLLLPKENLTKHKGIKCKICEVDPIIGIRFQCVKCQKYSLCEKCEEKMRNIHTHDFYLFSQQQKYSNAYRQYPYSPDEGLNATLLNGNELNKTLPYKNITDDLHIVIRMKNTGSKNWPKHLNLQTDDNETDIVIPYSISVDNLQPDKEIEIPLNFKTTFLNALEIGHYTVMLYLRNSYYWFGDKIPLHLIIANP